MNKLTSEEKLKSLILLAEEKKLRLEYELTEDANELIESIKPGNLIKKSVGSFMQSDHLKENALKAGAGLTAGFLLRKVLLRNLRKTIFSGVVGFALNQGINYVVNKNNEKKLMKRESEKINHNLNGMKNKELTDVA